MTTDWDNPRPPGMSSAPAPAPTYRIEVNIIGKHAVIRNDLRICTCTFRHDAERIAYCLHGRPG